MNKIIFSFLAVILVSVTATAQETELTAFWKKGDTKKIQSQDGYIEYEGNRVVRKEVVTSLVDMTVLEQTDSSFTIEWNYYKGSTEKMGIPEEEDEALYEEIDRLFEKLSIVYQTDEFGSYQGIVNMEEIETSLADSIDEFVKLNFEDKEEGQMFLELMNAMLVSDNMKDEISNEIQTYHYYLGEIFTDTLVTYDEQINSQMGKETIPAKGTVEVISNHKDHTLQINDKKVLDPIALKKAMIGAGKNFKKGKKKLAKTFDGHEFQMIDTEKYTYDYYDGYLKFYEKKRVFTSGNKRKDTFLTLEEIKL